MQKVTPRVQAPMRAHPAWRYRRALENLAAAQPAATSIKSSRRASVPIDVHTLPAMPDRCCGSRQQL